MQSPLRQAALVSFAAVLIINGVVRYVGGGDAHPLSLLRLPEKSRAVGLLFIHTLVHPFRSDEQELEAVVTRCATTHGISPQLALAVTRVESSFKPHAISSTGAMGLMQLMPDTADAYGVGDPFDVEQNATGGVRLLKDLLKRYSGDSRRALAAYNAGPASIPRAGRYGLPDETRRYVAKILD